MSWETLGHERALGLLQAELARGRLPQSLLLTGPRQVGKRTLALDLARAINCSASPAGRQELTPCGACRACRLSLSGAFPDLHVIELREGRQRIGIQEIQTLQSDFARRPAEGRRRIALIVDAERLSAEAENCLLKTLEEPPAQSVIILTAEEAASLLPTTISRCRRVRLRPLPVSTLAGLLVERFSLEPARARLLASLAGGRPGWAIEALQASAMLTAYEAALDRLRQAIDGSRLRRLAISRELAESWSGKAEHVRHELRVWTRYWRDLLLIKLGLDDRAVHVDQLSELQTETARFTLAEIQRALTALVQLQADLDQNANPRLAIDVALLTLPRPAQAA